MQPRFHAMYTLSFYFFERERKKRKAFSMVEKHISSEGKRNYKKEGEEACLEDLHPYTSAR